MKNKNDGGSAFPCQEFNQGHCTSALAEGMSLRDYFAAKAMQGIMSRVDGCHPADTKNEIGQWCYRVADAMIAERDK